MATRPSKITFDGHEYTIKDSTKINHRYRCMYYRGKRCKAEVHVDISMGTLKLVTLNHTCGRLGLGEHGEIDVREEMTQLVSEQALLAMGTSALAIWDAINTSILEKYKDADVTVLKPTKSEICSLVYRIRQEHCGGDVFRILEDDRYARLSPADPRLFLKLNNTYEVPDDKTVKNRLQRMLLWAHPDLLPILKRRKIACFIDGTFRTVPKAFRQCLIVMAFDDEVDLYVPIIFSLLTGGSEWTYWQVLHFVLVLTELKFDPDTITTDFERPLLKAIRDQFPNSLWIGCLFNFKQALRRKLVKLQVAEDQISRAMQRGALDRLTQTSLDQIDIAISQIRATVSEGDSKNKWDIFYQYFKDNWLKRYDFDTWNLCTARSLNVDKKNRTNNALENFNRQLNSKFPTPHPNIFHFIDVIREISCKYVRLISEIKSGNAKAPRRQA
jgi:hypothetical protein